MGLSPAAKIRWSGWFLVIFDDVSLNAVCDLVHLAVDAVDAGVQVKEAITNVSDERSTFCVLVAVFVADAMKLDDKGGECCKQHCHSADEADPFCCAPGGLVSVHSITSSRRGHYGEEGLERRSMLWAQDLLLERQGT